MYYLAQGTGRIFGDNWMKFGTYHLFGPRKKPIDFGQNRSTISPSSHRNVLSGWDFMRHKTGILRDNSMKFGTCHLFGPKKKPIDFGQNGLYFTKLPYKCPLGLGLYAS